MRYPVDQKYTITSQFGSTANRSFPHTGTDYVSDNKIVYAVEGGKAVSGINAQAGNFINVTIGNRRWLYGHLRDKTGFNGQVSEGTKLGIMGKTGNSTGVHLHLSLYIDGKLTDPNKYIESHLNNNNELNGDNNVTDAELSNELNKRDKRLDADEKTIDDLYKIVDAQAKSNQAVISELFNRLNESNKRIDKLEA